MNIFKRDADTLTQAANALEKVADFVEVAINTAAEYIEALEDGLDDFLDEVRGNAAKLREEAAGVEVTNESESVAKTTSTVSRASKIAYVQDKLSAMGLKDSKWTGHAANLLSDSQVDTAYKLWGGK